MALPPRDLKEKSVGLRERAVVWVVNRVLQLSKKVDVAKLQSDYGATLGRVCQMRVLDTGQSYKFRVLNGKIELLQGKLEVAGGFDVDSDTLIALARGRRRMMNPGSGEEYEVPFSPVDALTHGDLRVWGEAVTNDALLIARVMHEHVAPRLQKELDSGDSPR